MCDVSGVKGIKCALKQEIDREVSKESRNSESLRAEDGRKMEDARGARGASTRDTTCN